MKLADESPTLRFSADVRSAPSAILERISSKDVDPLSISVSKFRSDVCRYDENDGDSNVSDESSAADEADSHL